jgi:hypothetical protein
MPPSGIRKRNRAKSAATNPTNASHLGMTPVVSTTTEAAAMSTDMPAKAKRYIHSDSANERKPSCASARKFSKRASVAGYTISTAAPASTSVMNTSPPANATLEIPPPLPSALRSTPWSAPKNHRKKKAAKMSSSPL